jgi:hypothetical protein
VARLVGNGDGQHLLDLPEVWMHLAEKPSRHHERRFLVLDEVRHELHHGVFDVVGMRDRCRPVDGGRRIPLGGGGLRVEGCRPFRPDLVAGVERERRRRAARLDHGAARRQAPQRRGLSHDHVGAARALRADPMRADERAALDHCHRPVIGGVVDRMPAVALLATPRGQATEQIVVRAANRDRSSCRLGAQGQLDQHVRTLIESQTTEVDRRRRQRHGE